MTNNDVLRRLRYVFDYNDAKMVSLFKMGNKEVTRSEVSDWMKKDDDENCVELLDEVLAAFLNGMINDNRGVREGEPMPPETYLSNNAILMKLRIALELKSDDVLYCLETAGFKISKHELSAFFRKPEHKHYRQCKDQVLRYFLTGLQIKYRNQTESK